MTAENHSPPARSLRRTQFTNLWVVYNCALFQRGIFQLVALEAKIASGVYGSWKSAVPITP